MRVGVREGLTGAIGKTAALVGVALAAASSAPAAWSAEPPTPSIAAPNEPYPQNEGQKTCDSTPKPGVVAVKDMLKATYGTYGSSNGWSIGRACKKGGSSHHKEGRALDYSFSAFNAKQAAKAQEVINWLLKTDKHGNKHANARRLGVMYIIWNKKIWRAYDQARGWQRWTDPNPHTDHIHISFTWAGARKQTSWWTGSPSSGSGGSPVGAFDGAEALSGGAIKVHGWGYDPDAPKQPVDIHVYVGGPAGVGTGYNLGPARVSRPDVAKVYPAAGAGHGFSSTLKGVPGGTHTIYVYAINIGSGDNTLIGTREVTVADRLPFGVVDLAEGRFMGAAHVYGWAIDPAAPGFEARIHIYIDGPAGSGARRVDLLGASKSRPDVGAAYPGRGNNHGFDRVLSGLSPGKHVLYIYAIGRAGNRLLAIKPIAVGGALVGRGGAAVPTSSLKPGEALKTGQALLSPNREYALVMQRDGNLVLSRPSGVVWRPAMTAFAGAFAAMQTDGNFVVYNILGKPVWATMTNGKPGAGLHLQDDGNLVVYRNSAAVWWRSLQGVRLL
jgi:hypothetical protein